MIGPVVRAVVALGLSLVLSACGGEESPSSPDPGPPRGFALGFSDFPHAASRAAVDAAYAVIREDADLVMMHFDNGVPWEEALTGAAYPDSFQTEITFKANGQPSGHVRYLAVTPIAFARNSLAPRRGENGTEPLSPPWSGRAFDDPAVVLAFTNHCERMIAAFSPDYFAYGIEVNMLRQLAPERWPGFVRLVSEVYPRLKAAHPDLPVFLTFQVDFLIVSPLDQEAAIREVLPFTDVMAASSYWYAVVPDPQALAPDHFDTLVRIAPEKRFAVAETAWPAEDVTAPYPQLIPESEENQRIYVERLLADVERLDALFVSWFFTRDFDDLWEENLASVPDAALLRLWKDTGLYRGDGTPRPALDPWRAALTRPRR